MYNLEDLFKDNQTSHSQFQQDFFITTRSGGTTYGMYKQALRELYKRWRGLKENYKEKELLEIDIDELTHKVECYAKYDMDEWDLKREKVNLKNKIYSLQEMNKSISETEREFKRFYQQACALKSQIGELTDEKRHKLDIEMWEHKIKEMAALDYLANGRITKNVLELILCTPIELRHNLLLEIKQHDKLIQWVEDYNHTLPELEQIQDINLPKLLQEG
jgi:hypothetical protein